MDEVHKDLPQFKGKILNNKVKYVGPRHKINLYDYIGQTLYIDPKLIIRDEKQPRGKENFDQEKMNELISSLVNDGQELVVNITPITNHSTAIAKLLDGERRWRACMKASMPLLVFIKEDIQDENKRLATQLRSNHLKEEHVTHDIFHSIVRLHNSGMNDSQIALNFGRSPSWVNNYLKLADLIPEVFAMLSSKIPKNKRLKFSIAVEISKLPQKMQLTFAQAALQKKIGYEQIKKEVRRILKNEGMEITEPRSSSVSEVQESLKKFTKAMANRAILLKEQPNLVLIRAIGMSTAEEIEDMCNTLQNAANEINELTERIRKCYANR